MRTLRLATCAVALLLVGGEVARWWGQPRFMPMALDELLVGGAMLWAAAVAGRAGSGALAAAWGAYCGLVLALLVPTLDHLIGGPPKPSAPFYAIILAAMLVVGLCALVRAIWLIGERPPSTLKRPPGPRA